MYVGFGTLCDFRHPLGSWDVFPVDKGAGSYCFWSKSDLGVSPGSSR